MFYFCSFLPPFNFGFLYLIFTYHLYLVARNRHIYSRILHSFLPTVGVRLSDHT